MKERNCLICNRVFFTIKDLICPTCMKDEDACFRAVRNYVDDNPESPMQEVSANTGVPVKMILHLLREERLEIKQQTLVDSFLLCMQCRLPMRSGKLCQECKEGFASVINKMSAEKNEKRNPTPPRKERHKVLFEGHQKMKILRLSAYSRLIVH